MRLLYPFLIATTFLFNQLSCEGNRRAQARVWKRSQPYFYENGLPRSSRRLYRLHTPSSRIQASRTFHRLERNVRPLYNALESKKGPVLSKSSGRFYRKIAGSPTHRISPQATRNDTTLYGPFPYSEEQHHANKLKETERLFQDSRDYARTMGRTTMRTKIYSDIDATTPMPKKIEAMKGTTIGKKGDGETTATRPLQQQVEPSQMKGEKTKTVQTNNNKVAAEPPRAQPTQTTQQPFTIPPPLSPQFAALPFQSAQSPTQPQQQIQHPDFALFQQQGQFNVPPPQPQPPQAQFPGPLTGFQQFAQPNPAAVPPFFSPQPPQAQFPQPSLSQFPGAFPPQIPPMQQFSQVPPAPSPAPASNLQNQRLQNGQQQPGNQQFPITQLPNNLPAQLPPSNPSQFSSPSPIIPQSVNGSPFVGQQQQQQAPPSPQSNQPQIQQVLSPATFRTSSPLPASSFVQDNVSVNAQSANSSLEALGCAFDFVSNSCKDVFGLSWCGQCHDFGNLFVHDCKCVRPIYENIPRPQAQRSQQTAFVRTLQRGLA
ncbi:unnamed protein product, partial [Mesorhabditis belari]|uniref:Uncharacterized protein n=1 Tax=Mesorhabditis belari TaxID=2138241 RepID=A0AAF3ELA2_9BILA